MPLPTSGQHTDPSLSLTPTAPACHTTLTSTPTQASSTARVPPLAKLLGYAGAIPFLALTPQVTPLLPPDLAAAAPTLHVGYGVSIASFLGGITGAWPRVVPRSRPPRLRRWRRLRRPRAR